MPLIITDRIYSDGTGAETGAGFENSISRYVYIHRIDFKPFKNLSIGLSELLMSGNAPMELRYFNPLMIMHNFLQTYMKMKTLTVRRIILCFLLNKLRAR